MNLSCGSLKVFGSHKLIGGSAIREYSFVGGGWMTHAFNPDLEAGGHPFKLGHNFCWKCVTVGALL